MSSEEEKTGTEQAGDAVQQTEEAAANVAVEKKEEGMKQAYLAEKEKRQALEAEKELLEQQIAIAAANPPATQPQKPSSTFEQAVSELGLKDAQWFTPEQQLAIEARREQLEQTRSVQVMAQVTGRQFINSHPDYSEVVGTSHPVTGMFMPSKELRDILTKKPHLRASVFQGPEAAYSIVMEHRERAEKEAKLASLEEHQEAIAIDDSIKPMSPGSRGGGSENRAKKLRTYDDVRRMEMDVEAGLYD